MLVSSANRQVGNRSHALSGERLGIKKLFSRETPSEVRVYPSPQLGYVRLVGRVTNAGRPEVCAKTLAECVLDKCGASQGLNGFVLGVAGILVNGVDRGRDAAGVFVGVEVDIGPEERILGVGLLYPGEQRGLRQKPVGLHLRQERRDRLLVVEV